MPDDSRSRETKCPFYRRCEKYQLHCEGYCDSIMTVILRFQTLDDLNQHMAIFCMGRYDCCEIYRIIMEPKYSD